MRIINCEQYSPEWWEARRGIPTGSNLKRILTPTGKLSAQADDYICELIAERFHLGDMEELSGPTSWAMRQGTEREPDARNWYEFETGYTVGQVGFVLSDCGRYGSSPDGLIHDEGALELKAPLGKTHVRYLVDGSLPDEYKAQVHAHIIVTGAKWCDFLSYAYGLPSLLVHVEPDDYTEKLQAALEAFCDRYASATVAFEAKYGKPAERAMV